MDTCSEYTSGPVPVRLRHRAGPVREGAPGDHLQQRCRGGEQRVTEKNVVFTERQRDQLSLGGRPTR